MATYAEYFAKVCYKPKWIIGDRVFGRYKKVPFVGTVGNDSLVNPDDGPRVSIHLDLPIKVDKEYKLIIFVKPKDLKRLESIDTKEATTRKTKRSVPTKRSKSDH
jgi:hypothetical protein